MSRQPHPTASVVSVRTDGHHTTQVTVACPHCRGRHSYGWRDEADGLRAPWCGALGVYLVTVDDAEVGDARAAAVALAENLENRGALRERSAQRAKTGPTVVAGATNAAGVA